MKHNAKSDKHPRRLPDMSLVIFLTLLNLIPFSVKAEEKDVYDFLWLDPDKKVYVLQNKVHKKTGRTYFHVGYMRSESSNYFDTIGVQGLGGYYFNEQWAIEAFYNQYNNSQNKTYENLKAINGAVPFARKVNSSFGAIALWTPFYGKINTFNKIYYFDWSLGAGLGKVNTESNAKTVANPDKSDIFNEESYTGVFLKTGLRFHATENIHLELNYKRTQYQAPGAVIDGSQKPDKWRGHSDVIFGIGFSF